jgi:hypothetical protein
MSRSLESCKVVALANAKLRLLIIMYLTRIARGCEVVKSICWNIHRVVWWTFAAVLTELVTFMPGWPPNKPIRSVHSEANGGFCLHGSLAGPEDAGGTFLRNTYKFLSY